MVGFDPGPELQKALQGNSRVARDRGRRQHRPDIVVPAPPLRFLAIETSCDETAAAVVESGPRLRSNVIRSQDELHAPYGGVVPEIAARAHLQTLIPVIDRALATGDSSWTDIDALAVTRGPGLIGALLVGVNMAQSIGLARGLPVVGVSHLAGHLYAAKLEEPGLQPPALALIVSGGHSDLVRWQEDGAMEVVGRTRDDAAGEAFDKGARILGLPFPGGPAIDRLAERGNPRSFAFPRPRAPGLDFSFSGVKTSLLYEVRKLGALSDRQRADLAASYQEAIVDALLQRVEASLAVEPVSTVILGGGVARNRRLREAAAERLGDRVHLIVPAPDLCTDNAAMIGAAALEQWEKRGPDLAPFDADPGLGFS